MMDIYRDLVGVQVTTRAAAALTGVSPATATRSVAVVVPALIRPLLDRAQTVATAPINGLSAAEQARVVEVLTGPEFIDATPMQVYAVLLDRGEYLCSVSTMYRILRANTLVKDRRRQARHPARTRPELIATGPGQVYSWDITKLPGPAKGVYYDAYVMIDIYSRYIVGCHVHTTETAVLAEEMMKEVFGVHGIPQVVHADRGTSNRTGFGAQLVMCVRGPVGPLLVYRSRWFRFRWGW